MRPIPCVRLFAAGAFVAILADAGCASPPSIAEGQQLYRGNGCPTCHGPLGHGDGPVGRTLVPRPRDFRDEQAFKNGTSVDAIAATIENGLTRDGSQMPKFDHLSRRERESLALFVISMRNQTHTETAGRTP